MSQKTVEFNITFTATVPEHMTEDDVVQAFLDTGYTVEFADPFRKRPRIVATRVHGILTPS